MSMTHAVDGQLVHATVVAVDGCGVLIQGPSGSGKSDLALRLLDRGASLVSDDYALLWGDRAAYFAKAPPTIFGKLEVRGVGLIDWPAVDHVRLVLRVSLVGVAFEYPLLPGLRSLSGMAFDPSAPIVIEHAIRLGGAMSRSGEQ